MRGIAVLVGACTLAAGLTVAIAHAGGSSHSGHGKRVLRVQIMPKSFLRTDVDNAPKGPSEGDYYVFHDRLQNDKGARVGFSDGQCTAVAIEGTTTRYQCLVIETLQRGTIIHDGIFIDGTPSRFSIIGGTGDYAGAGGEATFDPPVHEFHFTD